MARKGLDSNGDSVSSAPRKARPWTPKGQDEFVDYELSRDEMAMLKARPVDGEALLDFMDASVFDGYRFTTKFEERNECVAVFMSRVSGDGPNSGLVLTGRGSTYGRALRQLAYKHLEVMTGDWQGWAKNSSGPGLDD